MKHSKGHYVMIDLLTEAGVNITDSDHEIYGEYKGREIRYITAQNRVEIGDDNFDRWANSVAASFTVRNYKSFQRNFNKMVAEAGV